MERLQKLRGRFRERGPDEQQGSPGAILRPERGRIGGARGLAGPGPAARLPQRLGRLEPEGGGPFRRGVRGLREPGGSGLFGPSLPGGVRRACGGAVGGSGTGRRRLPATAEDGHRGGEDGGDSRCAYHGRMRGVFVERRDVSMSVGDEACAPWGFRQACVSRTLLGTASGEQRRLRGGKKYLEPRSTLSISGAYEQRTGLGTRRGDFGPHRGAHAGRAAKKNSDDPVRNANSMIHTMRPGRAVCTSARRGVEGFR